MPPSANGNESPPTVKEQALGRKVSSGVSWMIFATFTGRFLSFVSTFVLGKLLSQDDFAVFGMAAGLSVFAQVIKDGGMRQLLIHKRAHRYEKLSGPTFWFSCAIGGSSGLILAIASFPIAHLYREPALTPVMLWSAVAIALATPSSIYRSRLGVDLQFQHLSHLNTGSAVVRNVLMVVFALMGFGAVSFTLPMVFVNLWEGAYGYWVTHDPVWKRPPRFRLWPQLWGKSKWLVLGTLSLALLRQGDYLVLGWLKAAHLVTIAVVGQYVFAYQIAAQINVVITGSLSNVLFPALSKLANEPERHANAVLRAMRVTVLLGSGFALSLACCFGPLEQLLWHGKWAPATHAVIWISAFFPLRLITAVLNATQLSKGRFREWFWLNLVQGVGMGCAAGIGGGFFESSGAVSLAIGLYFCFGVAPTVLWGMHRCGVSYLRGALAVYPTWIVSVAAAAATFALADLFPIHTHYGVSVDAILEIVIRTAEFSILFLIGLRAMTPKSLAEAVDIAPHKISRPTARALRLPERKRHKPAPPVPAEVSDAVA